MPFHANGTASSATSTRLRVMVGMLPAIPGDRCRRIWRSIGSFATVTSRRTNASCGTCPTTRRSASATPSATRHGLTCRPRTGSRAGSARARASSHREGRRVRSVRTARCWCTAGDRGGARCAGAGLGVAQPPPTLRLAAVAARRRGGGRARVCRHAASRDRAERRRHVRCGGPNGDNGLSGKKLVVDAYGPGVPIGGGAWSGKDFFKVDRLGGMVARRVALESLLATDADEAQVTLTYFPGGDRPACVDCCSTGSRPTRSSCRPVTARSKAAHSTDSSRWRPRAPSSLPAGGISSRGCHGSCRRRNQNRRGQVRLARSTASCRKFNRISSIESSRRIGAAHALAGSPPMP